MSITKLRGLYFGNAAPDTTEPHVGIFHEPCGKCEGCEKEQQCKTPHIVKMFFLKWNEVYLLGLGYLHEPIHAQEVDEELFLKARALTEARVGVDWRTAKGFMDATILSTLRGENSVWYGIKLGKY